MQKNFLLESLLRKLRLPATEDQIMSRHKMSKRATSKKQGGFNFSSPTHTPDKGNPSNEIRKCSRYIYSGLCQKQLVLCKLKTSFSQLEFDHTRSTTCHSVPRQQGQKLEYGPLKQHYIIA